MQLAAHSLCSLAIQILQRREMSVVSSSRGRETSPERNKVWAEPRPKTPKKVSVVYYLSRNGQLEHPHFMEVPLTSPQGLYLKGT